LWKGGPPHSTHQSNSGCTPKHREPIQHRKPNISPVQPS
jgi:hypothetical protein